MFNNHILLIALFAIFSCINQSENIIFQDNEEMNSILHCDNCNIELLRDLRLNTENIEYDKLVLYLKCLNKDCFKDIEFGQAANYSLFVLLQDQPKLIIHTINENIDSINIDYIRSVLENPISDDINIENIYRTLKDINFDKKDSIKEEVLKSLKIAIEKN